MAPRSTQARMGGAPRMRSQGATSQTHRLSLALRSRQARMPALPVCAPRMRSQDALPGPYLSNSPTAAGSSSSAASAPKAAPTATAAPAAARAPTAGIAPRSAPERPAAAIENDRIEPPQIAGAWSPRASSATASATGFGESGDEHEEDEHPDKQAKRTCRAPAEWLLRGGAVGVSAVFNARDVDVPFLGQCVEQGSYARGHRLGIFALLKLGPHPADDFAGQSVRQVAFEAVSDLQPDPAVLNRDEQQRPFVLVFAGLRADAPGAVKLVGVFFDRAAFQ